MTKFTIFCVVVEKRILGPQCPLPNGSCIWKHRQTSNCSYDEQFANSDFTATEYATRVGLPVPDPEALNVLKNSLADRIKHELMD